MAVPYAALALDAPLHGASIGTLFAVSVLVVIYRLHSAVLNGRPCWRRRTENATVVIGALTFMAGWAGRVGLTYVLAVYVGWAAFLAWPGAVSTFLTEGRSIGRRFRGGSATRDLAS